MMDYIIAGLLCYLIGQHTKQLRWCIPMGACMGAVVGMVIVKIIEHVTVTFP